MLTLTSCGVCTFDQNCNDKQRYLVTMASLNSPLMLGLSADTAWNQKSACPGPGWASISKCQSWYPRMGTEETNQTSAGEFWQLDGAYLFAWCFRSLAVLAAGICIRTDISVQGWYRHVSICQYELRSLMLLKSSQGISGTHANLRPWYCLLLWKTTPRRRLVCLAMLLLLLLWWWWWWWWFRRAFAWFTPFHVLHWVGQDSFLVHVCKDEIYCEIEMKVSSGFQVWGLEVT